MSIIYDALQKTQRNREYLQLKNASIEKKSHRRNVKWMLLSFLVLLLGAATGVLFSSHIIFTPAPAVKTKPPVTHPQVLKPAAIVSPEAAHLWVSEAAKPASNEVILPQAAPIQASISSPITAFSNKLTLNGVLISGVDKIALINNQSFHLGDIVDGMKIVGIEFNSIKLQNGQQIVELRVPA